MGPVLANIIEQASNSMPDMLLIPYYSWKMLSTGWFMKNSTALTPASESRLTGSKTAFLTFMILSCTTMESLSIVKTPIPDFMLTLIATYTGSIALPGFVVLARESERFVHLPNSVLFKRLSWNGFPIRVVNKIIDKTQTSLNGPVQAIDVDSSTFNLFSDTVLLTWSWWLLSTLLQKRI